MNARSTLPTVVALALLAVAVGTGLALADGTTVAAAQETNNSSTPDGWFLHDSVTVEQGETAAINVNLEHTDNATVVVGSNASTHRIVANVTDGDGDGTVGVQFDTAAVGPDGSRFATFRDADSVTVRSSTGPSDGLPAAGYSLQLYLGEPSGEPTNASILHVEAATTATTDDPTTTDEPTTDDATSTTADTPTVSTDATTTGGQPGFGPVVAVVGVLAAALLATRR